MKMKNIIAKLACGMMIGAILLGNANAVVLADTTEVVETVEAGFDGTEQGKTSDSAKDNTKDSTKTTKTTTTKASDSNEAKTAQSADTSNSNGKKELLTQKQRKSKYASKTNPKKGAKVTQQARNAFNGYAYADFSTYNSYSTENNLGRTPIYLLGTVMDIVPFSEVGNTYNVAMLVNDCDGYQWYMRVDVAKDKLDLFKSTYLGKAEYIFGSYAGYSGVLNRPMMDATIMIEPAGTAAALSIYQ